MKKETKIVIDSVINDLKNMMQYTENHSYTTNGAITLCITKLVKLKAELEKTDSFELTLAEKIIIIKSLGYNKLYRESPNEEKDVIDDLKKRLVESI